MRKQEYEDWDEEKQYTWADSQKAPGFAYVYMWYAALHANMWKNGEVNTFLFHKDISSSLEARSGILNAALSVIWKAVTGNIYCILYENEYPSMSVGTELLTKNDIKVEDARKTIISEIDNINHKNFTTANGSIIDSYFCNCGKDVCRIAFPDKMVLILQKPADDGLLLYAIDGSEQKEIVSRGVPYDILGRLQSLGDQALNALPDLIDSGWWPIGVPVDLD